MKNVTKRLRKFGFFLWILSIIVFLFETILFRPPRNGIYLGWQSFLFLVTAIVGVVAFLLFVSPLTLGFFKRFFIVIRKSMTKTAIFTTGLFLMLGIAVFLLIRTAPSRTPQVAQEAQKICNRTTPYDIPPALQRAISLVMQRYAEHNEPGLAEYKQMVNCLNIQFSDIHRTDNNTEGYFTFDTNQSSLDNQVVAVDAAFNDYDDLTAAVILSHELTHAKQYVDELANHQTLSCVDKEVLAFKQEVAFYSYLNQEEQRSLSARVAQGNQDNPELAQLQQLVNMGNVAAIAVNGGQNRAFFPAEQQQYNAILESKIRQMVVSISEYKKQCNL